MTALPAVVAGPAMTAVAARWRGAVLAGRGCPVAVPRLRRLVEACRVLRFQGHPAIAHGRSPDRKVVVAGPGRARCEWGQKVSADLALLLESFLAPRDENPRLLRLVPPRLPILPAI